MHIPRLQFDQVSNLYWAPELQGGIADLRPAARAISAACSQELEDFLTEHQDGKRSRADFIDAARDLMSTAAYAAGTASLGGLEAMTAQSWTVLQEEILKHIHIEPPVSFADNVSARGWIALLAQAPVQACLRARLFLGQKTGPESHGIGRDGSLLVAAEDVPYLAASFSIVNPEAVDLLATFASEQSASRRSLKGIMALAEGIWQKCDEIDDVACVREAMGYKSVANLNDQDDRQVKILDWVEENYPHLSTKASEVLTLLFPRQNWEPQSIKEWCQDHDFDSSRIDTTDHFHRVKQLDQDQHEGSLRTISFGQTDIMAVVCVKNAKLTDPVVPFFGKKSKEEKAPEKEVKEGEYGNGQPHWITWDGSLHILINGEGDKAEIVNGPMKGAQVGHAKQLMDAGYEPKHIGRIAKIVAGEGRGKYTGGAGNDKHGNDLLREAINAGKAGHHMTLDHVDQHAPITSGAMKGVKFSHAAILMQAGYTPEEIGQLHANHVPTKHAETHAINGGKAAELIKEYEGKLDDRKSVTSLRDAIKSVGSGAKDMVKGAGKMLWNLFSGGKKGRVEEAREGLKQTIKGGAGVATGVVKTGISFVKNMPALLRAGVQHMKENAMRTFYRWEPKKALWKNWGRGISQLALGYMTGVRTDMPRSTAASIMNWVAKNNPITKSMNKYHREAEKSIARDVDENGKRFANSTKKKIILGATNILFHLANAHIGGIVGAAIGTAIAGPGAGTAAGAKIGGILGRVSSLLGGQALGLVPGLRSGLAVLVDRVGYRPMRSLARVTGLASLTGKIASKGKEKGQVIGQRLARAGKKLGAVAKKTGQKIKTKAGKLREKLRRKKSESSQDEAQMCARLVLGQLGLEDVATFASRDADTDSNGKDKKIGGMSIQEISEGVVQYLKIILEGIYKDAKKDPTILHPPVLTDKAKKEFVQIMEKVESASFQDDRQVAHFEPSLELPEMVQFQGSYLSCPVAEEVLSGLGYSDEGMITFADNSSVNAMILDTWTVLDGWPIHINTLGKIDQASVGFLNSRNGLPANFEIIEVEPLEFPMEGELAVEFAREIDLSKWAPYQGKRGMRKGDSGLKHESGYVIWSDDPRYEHIMAARKSAAGPTDTSLGSEAETLQLPQATVQTPPVAMSPQTTSKDRTANRFERHLRKYGHAAAYEIAVDIQNSLDDEDKEIPKAFKGINLVKKLQDISRANGDNHARSAAQMATLARSLLGENPLPLAAVVPGPTQTSSQLPSSDPVQRARRYSEANAMPPGERGGPNSPFRDSLWYGYSKAAAILGKSENAPAERVPLMVVHEMTNKEHAVPHSPMEFLQEIIAAHQENASGGPDGKITLEPLTGRDSRGMAKEEISSLPDGPDGKIGWIRWDRPGAVHHFGQEEQDWVDRTDQELTAMFAAWPEARQDISFALRDGLFNARQAIHEMGNDRCASVLEDLTLFCKDLVSEEVLQTGLDLGVAQAGAVVAFMGNETWEVPSWLSAIAGHEVLCQLPVLGLVLQGESRFDQIDRSCHKGMSLVRSPAQFQEVGRAIRQRIWNGYLENLASHRNYLRSVLGTGFLPEDAVTFDRVPVTFAILGQPVVEPPDKNRILDLLGQADQSASGLRLRLQEIPPALGKLLRGRILGVLSALADQFGLEKTTVLFAAGLASATLDGAISPSLILVGDCYHNLRQDFILASFGDMDCADVLDLGCRILERLALEDAGLDIPVCHRDLDAVFRSGESRDEYGRFLTGFDSEVISQPSPDATVSVSEMARVMVRQSFPLYFDQPAISALGNPSTEDEMSFVVLPPPRPLAAGLAEMDQVARQQNLDWLGSLAGNPWIVEATRRWQNSLIRTTQQLYAVSVPRVASAVSRQQFASLVQAWLDTQSVDDAGDLITLRIILGGYGAGQDELLKTMLDLQPVLRQFAGCLVTADGRPVLAGRIMPVMTATGPSKDSQGRLVFERQLEAAGQPVLDLQYTLARQQLHRQIARTFLEDMAQVSPGESPSCVIVQCCCGMMHPCVPKILNSIFSTSVRRFTTVSEQGIREQIPEFLGWNLLHLWDESADITYGTILPTAVASRHNLAILVSSVATADSVRRLANQLERLGYGVDTMCIRMSPVQRVFAMASDFLKNPLGVLHPDKPPGVFLPLEFISTPGAEVAAVNWTQTWTADPLEVAAAVGPQAAGQVTAIRTWPVVMPNEPNKQWMV